MEIPGSSKNGNDGAADIVYTHNGIAEIYEIKPGSHAPKAKYNESGKAQLQRYITNYYQSEDYNNEIVVAGTSLNYLVAFTQIHSDIHPDSMIKYYVYPSDPGMIYWDYVKIKPPKDPGKEVALENKKDNTTHKKTPIITGEEVVEGVEIAAAVCVVAYGVWLAVKWSGAIALAPATGGASVAIAACTP